MKLSANDISAENLAMRNGEDSPEDIERHADAWIKGHQDQFNQWLDTHERRQSKGWVLRGGRLSALLAPHGVLKRTPSC